MSIFFLSLFNTKDLIDSSDCLLVLTVCLYIAKRRPGTDPRGVLSPILQRWRGRGEGAVVCHQITTEEVSQAEETHGNDRLLHEVIFFLSDFAISISCIIIFLSYVV